MLRYAYQVSSEFGIYPLLGSVVRALGQERWRVAVVSWEKKSPDFLSFQKLLKDPQRLAVLTWNEFQKSDDNTSYDLVLFTGEKSKFQQHLSDDELSARSHLMYIEKNPQIDEFDLISAFDIQELHSEGVIAVTGTAQGGGKGKTTTALGLAAEHFLKGEKVAIVQWFKEKKAGHLTWSISEHRFPDQLLHPERFSFYATGAGFVGSPNLDRVNEEAAHKQKAREGVELATQLIQSGEYSIVVLDEFVDTLLEVMSYLPYRLLEVGEVQALLKVAINSKTKVVVTGRQVTPEWETYIKTAITISEVKHPFKTSGGKQKAVPGLDY